MWIARRISLSLRDELFVGRDPATTHECCVLAALRVCILFCFCRRAGVVGLQVGTALVVGLAALGGFIFFLVGAQWFGRRGHLR